MDDMLAEILIQIIYHHCSIIQRKTKKQTKHRVHSYLLNRPHKTRTSHSQNKDNSASHHTKVKYLMNCSGGCGTSERTTYYSSSELPGRLVNLPHQLYLLNNRLIYYVPPLDWIFVQPCAPVTSFGSHWSLNLKSERDDTIQVGLYRPKWFVIIVIK